MAFSHLFYFICIAGALPVAIREPTPAPAQDPNDTETEVDGPSGFKVIYKGDKTETWKFWLWDFRRRGREAEYIELGETRERNLTASAHQNHNPEGSGQQPPDDIESGKTPERDLTASAPPNHNPEGSGQQPPDDIESGKTPERNLTASAPPNHNPEGSGKNPPGENETPIETEEGPGETDAFVVAGPSKTTRHLDVREGTRPSSPKEKGPMRALLAKIPFN